MPFLDVSEKGYISLKMQIRQFLEIFKHMDFPDTANTMTLIATKKRGQDKWHSNVCNLGGKKGVGRGWRGRKGMGRKRGAKKGTAPGGQLRS